MVAALQQLKGDQLVDVHKQQLEREGLDLILELVRKGAKIIDGDKSVKSESYSCWGKKQLRT